MCAGGDYAGGLRNRLLARARRSAGPWLPRHRVRQHPPRRRAGLVRAAGARQGTPARRTLVGRARHRAGPRSGGARLPGAHRGRGSEPAGRRFPGPRAGCRPAHRNRHHGRIGRRRRARRVPHLRVRRARLCLPAAGPTRHPGGFRRAPVPRSHAGAAALTLSAKWRTLLLLAVAECLAMGLWFSATAVAPALVRDWALTSTQGAWLTMAVQLGFVAGALVSALLNLPDLWPPKVVVAFGAFAGAGLTLLIPALNASFGVAVALRTGTGMALALVYPVGMKIMATWTREDRGLGLGLLVGALTVGSASPHLIRAWGGFGAWRPVLYAAAALAGLGGLIVWRFGQLGPHRASVPSFQWRDMGKALRVRPLRLANLGYLGHMWELYAMWTWVPLFLLLTYAGEAAGAAEVADGDAFLRPETAAALAAFAVIAAGGLGSVLAGRLADRWGRTRTTMLSMVISGSCAVVVGFVAEGRPMLATAIALLWGFAVVADSAQFSSSVSELSEPEYMGTQLTTQTSMGFLLTLASIQLVPVVQAQAGWGWAFAALAPGPALGTLAMWRLLRSAESVKLAGGQG